MSALEDADVETASADYARRFDSAAGAWMLQRQLEVTLGLLGDLAQATVLEVGGGHGQIAPALADRGYRVSVLASSPAAVGVSLQAALAGGRVPLLTGDLRNPPVDERSFDVVLSYRLLAHARDLRGLIAGLCHSSRKCVIVDYATTRSFNALAEPLFEAKKKVEGNTRPFAVMSDDRLSALFRDEGFARRSRKPQFFWPMALHRVLDAPRLSRALEGAAALTGLQALLGSPVIARFDRV